MPAYDEATVAKAPINIALVKYWGKSDEGLRLPLNASLSVTLSMETLYSETCIRLSPDGTNLFTLNGKSSDFNVRMQRIVKTAEDEFGINVPPIHVIAHNPHLPTGSGLASSASGYAAFTKALVAFLKISPTSQQTAKIARLGSGSACRSFFGGFVRWENDEVGPVPGLGWPELRCLVCIVESSPKAHSSTDAMRQSLLTSELLRLRIEEDLPGFHIDGIVKAVQDRNFARFGDIVMQESNQLHAICMDTLPPVRYLNDLSWKVMELVHRLNTESGRVLAAYTFDAGPNAFLFCLQDDLDMLQCIVETEFPSIQVIACRVGRSEPETI